jgi:hypothetical protein
VVPLLLIGLIVPAVGAAREAAQRKQVSNYLRQIGIGMHNYHDVYNALPIVGSSDPAVGVNMSWRTRLLPFIEERQMYDKMDFGQSWESPPNDQFQDQMPPNLGQPGKKEKRQTQFLVFTHEGPVGAAAAGNPRFAPATTWFHPTQGRGFGYCKDGTTNTIMAVEADPDRAVPWMKPADLALDPKNPKAGIGKHRAGGFMAVMGDGSVRFISNQIDDETMLKLILPNDGMSVDPESASGQRN